jgi:hypothetical protein
MRAPRRNLSKPTFRIRVSQMPIATTIDIIDFHNHHIPAPFELTAAKTAPASQRARWEALARKLSDEDLLLREIREGDISGRVVNIPAQLIADADGRVPHETIMAANDHLAALVARHSGRLHGWRRSMPMTATGPAGRPSGPSASSDCAGSSSIMRAATS